jgi:hypothetical protein
MFVMLTSERDIMFFMLTSERYIMFVMLTSERYIVCHVNIREIISLMLT